VLDREGGREEDSPVGRRGAATRVTAARHSDRLHAREGERESRASRGAEQGGPRSCNRRPPPPRTKPSSPPARPRPPSTPRTTTASPKLKRGRHRQTTHNTESKAERVSTNLNKHLHHTKVEDNRNKKTARRYLEIPFSFCCELGLNKA
jgi:hypothetical protein